MFTRFQHKKLFASFLAPALLAFSSNVMAFGSDNTDDWQQAIVVSLLLVALVALVRKRMDY